MTPYRTPWEVRLAIAVATGPHYLAKTPNYDHAETYTLERVSKEGFEYEIEVLACAEFEPAQHGGRTDPSWDAHMTGGTAFWYRPGKGWVELDLTADERTAVEEFLLESAADDGPEPDYDPDYGQYDCDYDY